jgi:hypothetical protein
MTETQSEHYFSFSEETNILCPGMASFFEDQSNNITLPGFSNIFPNAQNYCLNDYKNSFKKLFQVKKEISSSRNNSTEYTRKKRGRKKERENKTQTHDKYGMDNILRKIQNHFLSFIIFFINDILKALNYEQRFLKLHQSFKVNIKKDFVESLKKKTIGEIIDNKISTKYKKKIQTIDNKKIYKELKDKEDLKVLFKENYLELFKNIYHKNIKIINLKKYGIEREIKLSKEVKFYEDLLKKEAFKKDNEYIRSINECINLNFLS